MGAARSGGGGLSDSERARSTMAAVTGRHAAFYQLNKVKLYRFPIRSISRSYSGTVHKHHYLLSLIQSVLWTCCFSSSPGMTTVQAAANAFKHKTSASTFQQGNYLCQFQSDLSTIGLQTAGSHSCVPWMVFINNVFLIRVFPLYT